MNRKYIKADTMQEIIKNENSLDMVAVSIMDLFVIETVKKVSGYTNTKGHSNYAHTTGEVSLDLVKSCLKGIDTVAIFCGEAGTKFMTFDIDVSGDLVKAEEISKNIINILMDKFEATEENILVNYSGQKGLHVHLIFDNLIPVKRTKEAYNYVIQELELDKTEVEYRPTSKQAVKFPLQNHLHTKNPCTLVDAFNDFSVLNPYALLNVSKMDNELFLMNLEEVMVEVNRKEKIKNSEKVASSSRVPLSYITGNLYTSKPNAKANHTRAIKNAKNNNTSTNTNISTIYNNCYLIDKEQMLVKPNTRHEVTVTMGTFYNKLGIDIDEAIERLTIIIENTFENQRNFIDSKTTLSFAKKEIKRLVKIAYENNYQFESKAVEKVEVFEKELKTILSIKQKFAREVGLALLIQDKKYNTNKEKHTFTVSYRQINELLGTNKSHKDIAKAYDILEEAGLMTITNKKQIKAKKHYKDTTKIKIKYREMKKKINEQSIVLDLNVVAKENLTVEKLSVALFKKEDLKNSYAKSTFHRTIVKLYKKLRTFSGMIIRTAKTKSYTLLLDMIGNAFNVLETRKMNVNTVKPKYNLIDYITTKDVKTLEELILNYQEKVNFEKENSIFNYAIPT